MPTDATTNGATQTPRLEGSNDLLVVNGLKKYFPITRGILSRKMGYTLAVDDISFSIRQGETLGLVGESGCGKTTVGRCILRAYQPTAGEILYRHDDGRVVDLALLQHEELRPYRRELRVIFQDPYSSLNPRLTVFNIVSEVLKVNNLCPPSEMQDRVEQLLIEVGLRPEYMQRYPHAFSGGERQRIVIARALITRPRLVVCDEAVSALDVSIRAQILNLLEALQRDFSLTYLFIAHDLSVIRHICDRVVVMYVGKVVEIADNLDLYTNPLHPYTEALLSSVPIADPVGREARTRIHLQGEVADPSNPPRGCYFHPRCRYAQEHCRTEAPTLRDLGKQHWVACHFAQDLDLGGVIHPS